MPILRVAYQKTYKKSHKRMFAFCLPAFLVGLHVGTHKHVLNNPLEILLTKKGMGVTLRTIGIHLLALKHILRTVLNRGLWYQ